MLGGIQRAAFALSVANALCVVSLSAANADDSANRVLTVPVPNRGEPVVAKVDAEGGVHLLYGTTEGPFYAKSSDNGRSFAVAIPVVAAESRRPGLEFHHADMAVGRGGRVHVAMSTNAWKLKLPQREWALFYASLEPGAKEFSPVRNLNGKPSEGFSLAADDKGNVTACWLSSKLYANVSHDNGKTFGPNVELNPAYDPCDCCTTSAVYAADGRLAVLYREETNNERDMHLVLWDQAQNQTTRTRIGSSLWKIKSCPMSYYAISRTPGGLMAVWPTKDQIYFARFDHSGKPLGPEEIKTPGTAGHRTGMLALNGPDGSTLVAWSKEKQLGWQLYDANGRPSGSPGSAKTSGNSVAGVANKEGHFVLFQ